MDINQIEEKRNQLQILLDSKKTLKERNRLGQYSTPKELADSMVKASLDYIGRKNIRFLDTSIGTGVFFSSLLHYIPEENITCSYGYEIDEHYATLSRSLWKETKLKYIQNNFLNVDPPKHEEEKFNLIISNPPYIRHQHIDNYIKNELNEKMKDRYGLSFSGLTGLYCYFLALSSAWLKNNGISVWLIPNELLDVNYGIYVKQFLLSRTKLFRIHKFAPDNSKFSDALVTSIVLFYTTGTTSGNVRLTMGDNLSNPGFERIVDKDELNPDEKWSSYFYENHKKTITKRTLGDFFLVKRGIATGSNKHFILSKKQVLELKVPVNCIKPVLPSTRYIKNNIIIMNNKGELDNIPGYFLLNITCPEAMLSNLPVELVAYLNNIYSQIKDNYLIKKRSPWYKQEYRPDCPFLLTYMGRDKSNPFRLLLNLTNATVTNGYLMLYPRFDWKNSEINNKGILKKIYNRLLNILKSDIISFGRVYGGGLYKIEPNELMKLPIDDLISDEIIALIQYREYKQLTLFE
jgi:adenine-specific DNA methylase